MKRSRVFFSEWLADAQASGRYAFTLDEVLREGGIGERKSLWRAQRAGQIVRPRRGFYVIVPAEYRRVGAPPPSWFIDPLMKEQREPYYVGLLSAAALYGASAQAAQEFQVVVSRPLRLITVGRSRIRFVMRTNAKNAATVDRQVPTGHMRFATPEQTAIDVVTYPHVSAGWDNVASIIHELAPQLEPVKLTRVARSQADTRAAQRLGYLLDLAGAEASARALATWVHPRVHGFIPFEPRGSVVAAPRDDRWNLILNHRFEIE